MSSNFNMTPKYARGGIGDLLLCVESAIEEKEINIFSHFSGSPDIFTRFGVSINRFDYFKTLEELNNFFIPGEPLPTNLHPKFEVPAPPFPKPARKVIGVHIEGSEFSNNIWSKRGAPTKNMSRAFQVALALALRAEFPKAWIYFFCHPNRFDEIGLRMLPVLTTQYCVIGFTQIWDSLACVQHCDYVIGMDSSIKSMSAILKIPTVTLVGDYSDPYRDEVFLNPYVKEGIMDIVKFKDIDAVNPEDAIKYIRLHENSRNL